jgi:hypothetical protein
LVVLESGEPPGSDGRLPVETVHDDSAARERILFRSRAGARSWSEARERAEGVWPCTALFVFILVLVLVQIVFVGFSRCGRSPGSDSRPREEFLGGIGR